MTFNKEKLNNLIDITTDTACCVSIYIPTHRAGKVQEDKIRFKNALSEAENQLADEKKFSTHRTEKEAKRLLAPAYELLDNADFWLHLSDGLAVFINEEHFEYFIVPTNFNSFVYVGNEFYVRHLFPLVTGENRFFLLALSQGEVRFFEGHKHHITPVIINDLVPENIGELTTNEEASLQAHAGKQGHPIVHGQGAGKDQKNIDLKKYFQEVDKGLMEMLHDERAPLIIAAVDYLVPMYREVSNYSNIVNFNISGNPENDDPVLLHEKAMTLLADTFAAERTEKEETFGSLIAEEKASYSFLHVVKAAQEGRVDTLFVDKDTFATWGVHQHETDHTVKLEDAQSESNTCLLNYAAVQTWKNGGKVYNVPRDEFPNMSSTVNAVYRYSK